MRSAYSEVHPLEFKAFLNAFSRVGSIFICTCVRWKLERVCFKAYLKKEEGERMGEKRNWVTVGVGDRLGQPSFACAISSAVNHNLSKSVLQSRVVKVN